PLRKVAINRTATRDGRWTAKEPNLCTARLDRQVEAQRRQQARCPGACGHNDRATTPITTGPLDSFDSATFSVERCYRSIASDFGAQPLRGSGITGDYLDGFDVTGFGLESRPFTCVEFDFGINFRRFLPGDHPDIDSQGFLHGNVGLER